MSKQTEKKPAVRGRTTKPLDLEPKAIRMDPRLLDLLVQDAETLARENNDPRFGWTNLLQEIARHYYQVTGRMDEAGNVIDQDAEKK